MRFVVEKTDLSGLPSMARLEHNDEIIHWNVGLFDKMSYNDNGPDFDMFDHINSYWQSLPVPEQDKIFDVYKRIKDTFESVWDADVLTKDLYSLVSELYQYHELQTLRHWIDFHSNIIIPNDLHEEYIDSHDNPGTRERTYLKEDYKWLVTLSVALRIIIPVWGEFISRTRRTTGTVFKEYYAYKLLSQTNLIKSEPMERLRIYVERSLPMDKSKSAAILGGISSTDFPIWVLALVLVRRLSVGDVRGIDNKSTLITFIYKFIRQKVATHDNSFVGLVKDKPLDGQGQESETNLSRLEGYKIKQELPAGDIAIIEYYMQDTESIVRRICPDIDINLLYQSNETIAELATQQIWTPQIVITQWVLKKVVPPKGLLYLNKLMVLRAMAAAQALLWHKQHYVLAALVGAVEHTNFDELQLGGTDSRARIPKELQEELGKYYLYFRKPSGKQKVIKSVNPAIEAIDSVASMLSEHPWRLTIPQDWLEKVTNNKNSRLFTIPHNIKIVLANLVLEIAKKEF